VGRSLSRGLRGSGTELSEWTERTAQACSRSLPSCCWSHKLICAPVCFPRAALHASTIFTSLPSSSVVQSVYLQPPKSILTSLKGQSFPPSPHLPSGIETLCIDTSTHDVEVAKSVAKQMAEQTGLKAAVVDACAIGCTFCFCFSLQCCGIFWFY
jgi:3-hydroxyisobutyrate dehydrogenase-like beta-hydroxyacid dehydrogenase